MSYTVVFTPEAEAQILELYGYIAAEASPEIAARFADGIVAYCESFSTFPNRGSRREDIRPGLPRYELSQARRHRLPCGRRPGPYHRCLLWRPEL